MASLSRAWSRGAEIRCALTEDWLEHSFGTAGTEEDGTQLAPAAAEPLIDPDTGLIRPPADATTADSLPGSDAARRGRSRPDRLSETEIITLARKLGLEPNPATLHETWSHTEKAEPLEEPEEPRTSESSSLPSSLAPSLPSPTVCSRGPADGLARPFDFTSGKAAPRRSQTSSTAASHPVPPRSLRDVKLRALLETWQRSDSRQRTRQRFATDWTALDAAFGGGLPRAAVHELLAGTAAAPTRTMAFRLALRCLQDRPSFTTKSGSRGQSPHGRHPRPNGGWLLYLDSEPDLHPPALQRLGVPLDRLLIVRVEQGSAAQWVCELALRCEGIAAVIANLPGLDANRSRRLQLAAEEHGTLGLILRPDQPREGTFAFSRLRLDCRPGSKRARGALVTVMKLREATPPAAFPITLPLQAKEYEQAAAAAIPRIRTA